MLYVSVKMSVCRAVGNDKKVCSLYEAECVLKLRHIAREVTIAQYVNNKQAMKLWAATVRSNMKMNSNP